MKTYATISADIVSSTALTKEQRTELSQRVRELLDELSSRWGKKFYGRLVKGDYIECVLQNPRQVLRCALLLKSCIKSFGVPNKNSERGIANFRKYGIRIALTVGLLSVFDRDGGIIDGAAIYATGRAVNNKNFKSTLTYCPLDRHYNYLSAVAPLLDFVFHNMTARQSEVVFLKLLGKTEQEIIASTGRSQSTVYSQLRSAGWGYIESSLKYFENEYAVH